ncbi:unannotated protein [freshwater metagenome]|uniref:Unannotated protein n=1 Tax=freshwater metagenome TaxID=449393 RepID=A0A6J7NUQ2_9ZZZZ
MRRTELSGKLEFSVVNVHRDDDAGPGQSGSCYRGVTNTSAADHRDGIAARDVSSIDRCAKPGHHAATE